VARLLSPESAAVDEIAREVGVGTDTLERWRSDALGKPRSASSSLLVANAS
jgi:transposase